jgi:tripartite-type tricarboxylate transporter receptor subunit TctC
MALGTSRTAICHREPARRQRQPRHRGGREGGRRRIYAAPDQRGQFAPVASVFETPLVVEVNPSVPVHTIPEFITYAKDNVGKLNMGTPGVGTPPHVAGELFKMMPGLDMVHVPYRGTGPMLTDLIGGQVQIAFDPLPASIQHIRAGKLRALAVTTASRSEALPGIPSASEAVPGYIASLANAAIAGSHVAS